MRSLTVKRICVIFGALIPFDWGFFMQLKYIFATHVCLLTLLGCSTSRLTPDIETFGTTVSQIVAEDRKTEQSTSLSDRVHAARRADFAGAGIRLALSEKNAGLCAYDNPALEMGQFSERCELEAILYDPATGEQLRASSQYDTLAIQAVSERVIRASDQNLLRELLADRLKTDLERYARQLVALTTATEPTDISAAAGRAFDVLHSLKDEVDRAEAVTNTGRLQQRVANRTLLTTLAGEALELWRYNLLRKTVENSNDSVLTAAAQLVQLSFEHDETGIEEAATEFREVLLNHEPGSEASLQAVEEAYTALSKRDERAAFRRYINIAQAHEQILQSLKAPADIQMIAEANRRIIALSEAIRAVD